MWKRVDKMYLSFLILLVYSCPTLSLDCESGPNCPASISSNYTLVLNISSNVLAQNGGINHVLQNENVILTATAYSNDNSSNFTDIIKQSPFYFKFQYRNSSLNKHGEWSSIKCLKDKSSATVKHSWNFGGNIECLVELLTEDNETLACSSIKSIQIAVETIEECLVEVATYQENHDTEKSAFAIGNVTFMSNITLNWIISDFYLLYYSFGDKTNYTLKRNSPTISANHTHNYTDVCDECNYEVTVISVSYDSRYCRSERTKISVIMPVTPNNSDITVNSGKKLYKQHPANLGISTDATLPLNVCWHLYHPTEKYNISNNCPLSHKKHINGTYCQKVTSPGLFDNHLDFPDSGMYTLLASIENNANCMTKNYTLKVDTVPVSAGEVAGGVIGIVVSCVVVVMVILWVFLYIQYRRYKNRHIETAKFNFVVLPPINTDSRWARFKLACRRRWYKFIGRRFKEGLVPTIDASGHYTYSDSYSTTVSYGTLLQSERSESCKDHQVSLLHDYVSNSGYHGNEHHDDR